MGFSDIFKIKQFKAEIERLQYDNSNLSNKLNELGYAEYEQVKIKISQMEADYNQQIQKIIILLSPKMLLLMNVII